MTPRHWSSVGVTEAANLSETELLDITMPTNELGERCPWPWDPQQLAGAPIGQYHCPYCGAMVLGGVPHLDYSVLLSGKPGPDEPEPEDL